MIRPEPDPSASAETAGAVRPILWAALILLLAGAAASGQTDPEIAYPAAIETLCRQYAAAQVGMPADLAFDQCMLARHCRVSPGSPHYRCELPGPMAWHGGGY